MLTRGAGNKSGCSWYIGGVYSQGKWVRLPSGRICIDEEEKSAHGPASSKEFKSKISEMEKGACFTKEVITCILLLEQHRDH